MMLRKTEHHVKSLAKNMQICKQSLEPLVFCKEYTGHLIPAPQVKWYDDTK